jgi:HSP20 family protein
MSLMRRNPYDPLFSLEQAMDRMRSMLNTALVPFNGEFVQSGDANTLAVDMTSDEKHIIIRTALPGFKEDEVNVDVRGNMVTITAETKTEREDHNANWHIREMRYGKFARTLVLPEEVAATDADASLDDGILTVKLPKQKPGPVHKIAVKARNLLKGGK